MSAEFRKKAHQRIAELERKRGHGNSFSCFFPINKGISASHFTVVYAIIVNWKTRTLCEALPFFSKINLRCCIQDLRRMGYQIAYGQIAASAKTARHQLQPSPPSVYLPAPLCNQQVGKQPDPIARFSCHLGRAV
jgi:hypothetical protein